MYTSPFIYTAMVYVAKPLYHLIKSIHPAQKSETKSLIYLILFKGSLQYVHITVYRIRSVL